MVSLQKIHKGYVDYILEERRKAKETDVKQLETSKKSSMIHELVFGKENMYFKGFDPFTEKEIYENLVKLYNIPKEDIIKYREDLAIVATGLSVIAKIAPHPLTAGAAGLAWTTVGGLKYYEKKYDEYHKTTKLINKSLENIVKIADSQDSFDARKIKADIDAMKKDIELIGSSIVKEIESIEKEQKKGPIEPKITEDTLEQIIAIQDAVHTVDKLYITNIPKPKKAPKEPKEALKEEAPKKEKKPRKPKEKKEKTI